MRVIVRSCFVLALVALWLGVYGVVRVGAQPAGVAVESVISEAEVGNLVCVEDGVFVLCEEESQASLYGIVTDLPELALERDSIQGVQVVSTGEQMVLVSNAAGEIATGDMITSSSAPGIGQRANQNGAVLGVALQDAVPGNQPQLIPVLVNITLTTEFEQGRGNLLSLIRAAPLSVVLDPLSSFRYAIAALLVLISFFLGFVYFGRMARAGVEALGRNPLAARQIQLNVLINSLVTVMIVLAGLGSAYLILIL